MQHQWVTQVEIEIIKTYINARADSDKNIIPILEPPIISETNKTQMLGKPKTKDVLHYMFYFTNANANTVGIETHYKGLFSESALNSHLLIKELKHHTSFTQ